MLSLARALAKIITEPDFHARPVVIERHGLFDAYLHEWWPLYYRQLFNILAGLSRPYYVPIVLEHWLRANWLRIETIHYLQHHPDYVGLRQASRAEGSAWLLQHLGAVPSCNPETITEFVFTWVPQILAAAQMQRRTIGLALQPVLIEPNKPSALH